MPGDRVTKSEPFEMVRIDFAGPLFVMSTDGNDEKAYIALFICVVNRAIHLELVSSLSTVCFLLAFKRFTARCSIPTVIYTDNALTFKKAEKRDLERRKESRIPRPPVRPKDSLEIHCQGSSLVGGFWERMVRVVKNALKETLGRSRFNFEELTTILHDVEAAVNSRPLTFVSDTPGEEEPLTPDDFLVGKRMTSLPSFDVR